MGIKIHRKSFKFYDNNRNSKEWLKQKEKYLALGGAKCSSFLKNRHFFLILGRQPWLFATTKQEPLLQKLGNPSRFPSVVRTATQQVQLCPRISVTVYHRHKYLFTALDKHDSSLLFLIGYTQPKEKQRVFFYFSELSILTYTVSPILIHITKF